MGKVRLNLGCGTRKLEGYINVDCRRDVNPDLVWDLERPLPFGDNVVDEVYTSHTLEHIRNLVGLMEEIWRICKPGAIVTIVVPYGLSDEGMRDPTHVRFFTLETFDYFDKSSGLAIYPFRCNFKVEHKERRGNELHFRLRVVK